MRNFKLKNKYALKLYFANYQIFILTYENTHENTLINAN